MTKDATTSRRAVLGSAATLVGLAGCTSSLTKSNDTTTSSSGTQTDGGTTTSGANESLLSVSDETTKYGIDLQDNPIIGSKDAGVDIYYWSDYQCPFCNRFEQMTFPQLVDKQIRPGNVRLVLLELPNIGSASDTASRMAKCVWRQVRETNPDAFKRWHEAVFDKQKKPNSGWAKKSNLLDITGNVNGVDASAVKSCLSDETESLKSSVTSDVDAGTEHNITATPGFILFNRESEKAGRIVGAQPYDRFKSSIKKIRNA